ncbi:hypothetical protein M409DRAFT_58750 [Zasmidium cellare ATCC 36951]|uniref:Uncharacterized protein n=1 Tax=Zasmidium cellare ATCC 36951 TaxID=1080233 RepID=A0A6A6C970_ZASCE|nr:uncharacterized protein M409DRAFT_58750 [Zasmidium cellare ATCC 36951]KAF2161986.1 hypothetical protein M409DRAFT_58750 [Zasmidium cellare ATCC 36951]
MSKTFAFICTGPGVNQDARKDVRFAARSHTAKVNRNRRKQALSRRRMTTPMLGMQPRQSAALFGASNSAMPDISSPAVADIVDFLFRSVLTQPFTPSEIGHWFQGFCETPLLYHSWAHHRFFVESRMRRDLPGDRWQSMVSTRSSAHHLIGDSLSDPGNDRESIEKLLLAMALTSQHERDASTVDDLPLCIPHMLYTEGFDVFRVRQLDGFLPAAVSLISRLPDGLESLVDTGLFRIMCMVDLLSAAASFAHPFFPCGWEHPFHIDLSTTSDEAMPGHGFHRLGLQGALPRSTILVKPCHLDRFMANYDKMHLSSSDFQDLLAWRNAVVHELLSLPTWEGLSDEEKSTSFQGLYECCRLAATLYCNAIICATPAGSRGITEPLRQLTAFLEVFSTWRLELSEVALWASFVGGLASYGTEYWKPIVRSARYLTKICGISSIDEVQTVLHRWLWSDSACELGTRALWTALSVENDDIRIEYQTEQ